MNNTQRHTPSLRLSAMAAALAAALLTAIPAHAQLSSATIQGQVTSGTAPSARVTVL